MHKTTSKYTTPRQMAALVLALCSALVLSGCSAKHVPEIKANAEKTFAAAGYDVIGYEGFQYGCPGGNWGGKVWYIVRRKGDNRVTYNACLSKWGDEYHIYNLAALDAIKPQ